MIGWRGWIGRVEPALWTEGSEWAALLPPGFDVAVSCSGLARLEPDQLAAAYGRIVSQVQRLAAAGVDVIDVGGSPVVGSRGVEGWRSLEADLRRATDKPVITALGAEVDALRALGARRLAMASPYADDRNRNRVEILTASGFEVVALSSLGIGEVDRIARLPDHAAARTVHEALSGAPEVDAIYVPCAAWPVVRDIAALEERFGLPVVTCVQAQAWACLRAMGYRAPLAGFGRLLDGA